MFTLQEYATSRLMQHLRLNSILILKDRRFFSRKDLSLDLSQGVIGTILMELKAAGIITRAGSKKDATYIFVAFLKIIIEDDV